MIEFVVGEDQKLIHEKVKECIHKLMMKNNMDYKIISFYDYDKAFFSFTKTKNKYRIYILDIVMKSATGLDAARKIRQKDITSLLIFLTAYDQEFKEDIYKGQFMYYASISKREEYSKILEKTLQSALHLLGTVKALRFYDQKILYTIPLEDILYITTDTNARKTLIITNYTTFKVSKTLANIEKKLSNTFIRTHRSCIVNKDHVVYMDMKKQKIFLDNQETLGLLSRAFKQKKIEIG